MNLLVGLVVVLLVSGVAVTAMLLVRRQAPEGSYFKDGDRASGVFGVMATGFSVLLGFIIFLAFTSYDAARAGAESEAATVAQQIETAQFFPDDSSDILTAQLICYGRSVAGTEWEDMEDGSLGDRVNPWAAAMFETVRSVEPSTDSEQSAYDRWMDQTSDREDARSARVHSVPGVVPAPLWIVLYLIAGVIFAYMLFFADSAEGAGTQAMLMGSVAVVVTTLLLLLVFLDEPYGDGLGALEPDAMERALRIIDQEMEITGTTVELPCDRDGLPT
jgi:hypothetical protein